MQNKKLQSKDITGKDQYQKVCYNGSSSESENSDSEQVVPHYNIRQHNDRLNQQQPKMNARGHNQQKYNKIQSPAASVDIDERVLNNLINEANTLFNEIAQQEDFIQKEMQELLDNEKQIEQLENELESLKNIKFADDQLKKAENALKECNKIVNRKKDPRLSDLESNVENIVQKVVDDLCDQQEGQIEASKNKLSNKVIQKLKQNNAKANARNNEELNNVINQLREEVRKLSDVMIAQKLPELANNLQIQTNDLSRPVNQGTFKDPDLEEIITEWTVKLDEIQIQGDEIKSIYDQQVASINIQISQYKEELEDCGLIIEQIDESKIAPIKN